MSGKIGNRITLPAASPVYDEEMKVLFISWDKYPAKIVKVTNDAGTTYPAKTTAYDEKDMYLENTISTYSANAVEYIYTITFYDGDQGSRYFLL